MRPLLGVLNVLNTGVQNVIVDSAHAHPSRKPVLSPGYLAGPFCRLRGMMATRSLAIAAAQQVTAHAMQSTLNPKPLTLGLKP